MMDFDQLRERAFEDLAKIFTIEKTTVDVKTRLGTPKKIEQWKVTLEVPLPEGVTDFTVLVELKDDFPLSLPVIYLAEDDYEKIKYVPHIDDRRNICLFDNENIKLDPDRPAEIIKACLKQAATIISDGITGVNNGDFVDEIVAYWANVYDPKDQVFEAYLGDGIDAIAPGVHPGHLLSPAYHNVDFLMSSGSEQSQQVIAFFKTRGHKVTEQAYFYLGQIGHLVPPFYIDNRRLISYLREHFSSQWSAVKRYLNQSFGPKIFAFSLEVNGQLVFFGFYIPAIQAKIDGWRRTSLTSLNVLDTVQPSKAVARIAFKYFSQTRLQKRTDGILNTKPAYKFMVAGLGSIGSNLLSGLNSLEVSEFVLCDPDIFALENVNRHLLSFNEVGKAKVDALAKYLTFQNPFLHVHTHKGSIVDMIRSRSGLMNTMDVIFCAIGKDAIENYVLESLSEGIIGRPVMLFWVEPYLAGGHALYIRPSTGFSLKDLETNGYYRYNVISAETYADPGRQTLLREAGCQGSYVPYGKAAISLFFAHLIPELYRIIAEPPDTNIAISYAGDLSLAVAQDLQLSDFGNTLRSHQLTTNAI
ncbi:hypothetical protein FPZ43_18020 [Mucilaginibacter pallidiroseus]|uniref:Uncharacterized protein n=1 Tax=Mucilaginibacter pallidiroseus TaxID=2599295 RepID=A0A563TZT0_9SPHI|nr:ThiF family adenylyltransferase [Mucilaginibacter pallidiroseus]TWR24793.1 hypothetical protein FPZ43_18020 [Mucilaginibacter pallidiroseus]